MSSSQSSYHHPLLTLHVGQAGIQIGHAAWELLCLEHNICTDGMPMKECGDHGFVDTMFVSSPKGRYFPRTIFVDTDPFCVDEVRTGPYRGLFSRRQLLSDHVDAGTNYATGRYGYTKQLLPDTVDRLRWLAEKTDTKPTLFMVHSACGGTGSGFSVACLTQASEELGLGPSTLDLCLMPGRMAAQNSCELFNTALYLDESQSLVRQTFCVSNSALFRVCADQLRSEGRATYAHANRLLAMAFSNLTATERLPGSSVTMSGILDSLLPFPHLKYSMLACAPFLTPESAQEDEPTVRSVTSDVLELGSQFMDVDPTTGHHAAAFLLYRGAANPVEYQHLAADLLRKGRVRFHDWAPAGFRTGHVTLPPLVPPNSGLANTPLSVTMVTSHSSVSSVFAEFARSARRLQMGDRFVHNYEGAIVAMLSRRTSDACDSTGGEANVAAAAADHAVAAAPHGVQHWMAGLTGDGSEQRPGSGPSTTTAAVASPWAVGLGQSAPSRSGGLSDVFGVRLRLTVAVDFLEMVVRSYSTSGVQHQQQREELSRGEPALPLKVEPPVGANPNAIGENASGRHKKGGGGEDGVSESESTVRWAEQLLQTDYETADSPPDVTQQQQQHTQQHEQQFSNSWPLEGDNVDFAGGASDVSWSSGEEAPTDRSGGGHRRGGSSGGGGALVFGCLRRKRFRLPRWKLQKQQQLHQHQQHVSSSRTPSADRHHQQHPSRRHPAIAEAERVLEKYRAAAKLRDAKH